MICAPIKKRDINEVLRMVKKVPKSFDLVEVWINEIKGVDAEMIAKICEISRKPLLIKLTELNSGKDYDFALIKACLNDKVKYVDFEYDENFNYALIKELVRGKKIMISYHNYANTPLFTDLLELAQKIKEKGADVAKIITKAEKIEDNLITLRLLSNSNVIGIPLISFCTGEMGKMSRLYASKFGSLIDYVLPSEKYRTAEGQILINDFKKTRKCD